MPRDELLDRLASVNPFPDASWISEDVEMSQRLSNAISLKDATHTTAEVARLMPRPPSSGPRRRFVVAAAAAVLVLVVGAVAFLRSGTGQDVTVGPGALQAVFDGDRCSVGGPDVITAGEIELVFLNQSNTPGTDWMELVRVDAGRTEQDLVEYLAGSFTNRPSWVSLVVLFDLVGEGETRSGIVPVQPGLHALVCGANVAGGGNLPAYGVMGRTITVVP